MIFVLSKLLFDKKTALIAVSLAALNHAYIFFPKMIRCYSFLNFLGLLSFYIFFRIAKSKIVDNKRLVTLLVINTAILYTFYFGVFVILLELALSCFLLGRRGIFKIWLGLLSSFVFFLPWLKHFLNDLSNEAAVHFKISNAANFMDVLFIRLKQGIFHDTLLLWLYVLVCLYSVFYACLLFFKKDEKAPSVISLLAILIPATFVINYLTSEVRQDYSMFALKDPARARYLFSTIFPIFILAAFFIKKLPRHIGALAVVIFISCSVYAESVYFRSPDQKFWPAQLAPVTKQAKDFQVAKTDKVIIEIEDSFFVPIFVYYFYGPRYFREASVPYGGANLKQLNSQPGNKYKAFYNVAGMKEYHNFYSASQLDNFDWLYLIYSNWLKVCWGKPFRQLYDEKLAENGMADKILPVKKDTVGAFTIEIYKIKKQ
jgi:hypothetical protein